ncbi:DEKNAAC104649 [Brettanomyces naardenensis]|uniref:DEKNAAC104649 n=1 Tax=Brettanomyces naardenensis TaxID=13370 RepID=A0A448YRN6_BRENA|nr:DEKNAAC104649 [Brettanomyces naardenensis]
MASYPKGEKLRPLGALCIDYTEDIHRPPGDPLNPGSFPFPLLYQTVPDATIANVVNSTKFSDEQLQSYVNACERLAKQGAIGIITSCGFLAQAQTRLAKNVSIPVATSSLLQIPYVLSIISPDKHVGILTYDGDILGDTHFDGIGITREMKDRITVVGSYQDGPLHGIIRDGGRYVFEELEQEMISISKDLVKKDPLVGAIVLECTQMPPFAKAVQKASGLPVYDVLTMIDMFYSGLHCRYIPEDDDKEDGLKLRKRSDKEGKQIV